MDRVRIGRAVRALRLRRGWRQADLADRAGLSRSVVGRIEQGQIGRITYDDLERAVAALDAQLDVGVRWRGASLDRLIDEHHAALVDAIVRLFKQREWEVDVEVSFSIFGERGSIDVFGRHPASGLVAVVEAKATVGEAGATVIGLDRKARLAPVIARERGWDCRGVARVLVVADTSTARDRVARHGDTFRTAFPVTGRDCLAWIREPAIPPPSGLLFIAARNARGTGTQRCRRRGQASSASGSRTTAGDGHA